MLIVLIRFKTFLLKSRGNAHDLKPRVNSDLMFLVDFIVFKQLAKSGGLYIFSRIFSFLNTKGCSLATYPGHREYSEVMRNTI